MEATPLTFIGLVTYSGFITLPLSYLFGDGDFHTFNYKDVAARL